jgi:exopolysaccharide biosynthesis polyprenyl glycosylphosphotransferase
MTADVVLTIVLLAVMVKARPFLPGKPLEPSEAVLPATLIYVLVGLLWHVLFAVTGVYELRAIPRLSQQLGRFTSSYLVAVLTLTGFFFFTFRDVSRLLVIYFCLADYIVLLITRYVLIFYLRHSVNGIRDMPVLIAGASESGIYLADTLRRDTASGLKVVGFVDSNLPPQLNLPEPVIGSFQDVPRIVLEQQIGILFVALPETRRHEVEDLIHLVESLAVRVYVVPEVPKAGMVNLEVETLGELVLIGIREPVIQGHRRVIKRVMDVSLCTVGLLLTWPLFVLMWIAVRLDSPGPAIFVAQRVGENGKIFNMLKFRTMYVNQDNFPAPAPTTSKEELCEIPHKLENDPRVTRVGKFLRKTSLDELPQLINVLKGDMSLVGPRPEQPYLTQCYDHWQWQRLSVPPGVTGWWQISGRSDLPMHLNTQYDMYYVRNYSVLLDLKILFKTVGTVLKGKGAY